MFLLLGMIFPNFPLLIRVRTLWNSLPGIVVKADLDLRRLSTDPKIHDIVEWPFYVKLRSADIRGGSYTDDVKRHRVHYRKQ